MMAKKIKRAQMILLLGVAGIFTTCGKTNDSVATSADPESNIVVFEIKEGTGNKSWNTQAETVKVKLGQTLRIKNLDSKLHRLHTDGTPCPHGPDMPAKTGVYDCKVTKVHDPKQAGSLYDHYHGPSAKFWVHATK